jgi:hypothetical protein
MEVKNPNYKTQRAKASINRTFTEQFYSKFINKTALFEVLPYSMPE